MAINTTMLTFDPVMYSLQGVVNQLEVLVGGMFGLYLFFIIYKVIEMKRQKKVLKDIKHDISLVKKKLMINEIKERDKRFQNENFDKKRNI